MVVVRLWLSWVGDGIVVVRWGWLQMCTGCQGILVLSKGLLVICNYNVAYFEMLDYSMEIC